MKLVPITPKGFADQMRALPDAVKRGMRQAAEKVKQDFEQTTATWEHQVEFTIMEQADGSFVVGTDDRIWGYVNEGTPPHIIVPKRGKVLRFGVGGSPKTQPGRIKAGSGSPGSAVVIRPRVNHPGTEARDFTGQIAKHWRRGVQPFIRAAIEEVLR